MKNLALLIIHDDIEQTDYLESILRKLPIFLVIKSVKDPILGYSELLVNKYDLLILDLDTPKVPSIDLIKSLSLPPTIVISSNPNFAIECFDWDDVVDFIKKPITLSRFGRAIRRTQQKANKQNVVKTIYFKVGHRNQQYKTDDILYIEADGIYSKIYLKSGEKALANSNISEIEKQLKHTKLVRLHKSYIYNCAHITSFDSRYLWIGNQKFALGVNFRGKLAEYLNVDFN